MLEKVGTESGVYVLDLSITKVELIVNGDHFSAARQMKESCGLNSGKDGDLRSKWEGGGLQVHRGA